MSTATRHVSEQLVRRLGERKFDMWFGSTTQVRIRGRKLEVAAENQHVADWIGTHFGRDLKEVAVAALGEEAEVDVRVDQSLNRENGSGSTRKSPARKTAQTRHRSAGDSPRRTDLHLPLRHRLEDFVVGESNRLAHSSATFLAEAPAEETTGPLFLYGECGLGKTHLLQGTCRRHIQRIPGARVRYTTGEQFTNEYIAALKNSGLEGFRRKLRNLDFLAIDDIHFLSNKTATQAEFLHTMDAIGLSGARVVMASDEHPQQLRSINRALVSRFLAGLVVPIERPERELRIELVRRLAERRGLRLNAQAIEIIAANCVGSVREIEGAITRLTAMSRLPGDAPGSNGEIGCVLVERLFRDNAITLRPLRVTTIIDVVCQRLGVERHDLLGSTRHRKVVTARGIVSYLARDLTTMSFPEIGRSLGRKNHSTVLTASRRLSDQIQADEAIRLEPSEPPIRMRELVDQLRHEVRRAARE